MEVFDFWPITSHLQLICKFPPFFITLNICCISSSVLPFVSGTNAKQKMKMKMRRVPNVQKVAALPTSPTNGL